MEVYPISIMIIFKKSKNLFFLSSFNNVFIVEKRENKNNRRCQEG